MATGLSLYALRRVKIMRAMGTLKNDELKVIYKRVNSFNLNYSPYGRDDLKNEDLAKKYFTDVFAHNSSDSADHHSSSSESKYNLHDQ